MELKVTSYNCDSIRNSVEIVKALLNDHDIILLQETILSENNLDFLNLLTDNFNHAATASTFNNNSMRGRASGGLAIYWTKKLTKCIKPIYFTERIMGVKIIGKNKTILLLNVYIDRKSVV